MSRGEVLTLRTLVVMKPVLKEISHPVRVIGNIHTDLETLSGDRYKWMFSSVNDEKVTLIQFGQKSRVGKL